MDNVDLVLWRLRQGLNRGSGGIVVRGRGGGGHGYGNNDSVVNGNGVDTWQLLSHSPTPPLPLAYFPRPTPLPPLPIKHFPHTTPIPPLPLKTFTRNTTLPTLTLKAPPWYFPNWVHLYALDSLYFLAFAFEISGIEMSQLYIPYFSSSLVLFFLGQFFWCN